MKKSQAAAEVVASEPIELPPSTAAILGVAAATLRADGNDDSAIALAFLAAADVLAQRSIDPEVYAELLQIRADHWCAPPEKGTA